MTVDFEDYRVVVELYKQGYKPRAIQRKTGIDYLKINRYIHEAKEIGLIPRNSRESKVLDVVDLFTQGKTPTEIADALGLKRNTVNYYVFKARAQGLLEEKPKIGNVYKVLDLYKEGKSKTEIAETLGLEPGTVKGYLYKAKQKGLIDDVTSDTYKTVSKESEAIIALYKLGYKLTEISSNLHIRSKEVYDTIEGIDDKEAKKIKKSRLKSNSLYHQIVEIKKEQGIKVEKILYNLYKTSSDPIDLIDIANMYYLQGNYNAPNIILKQILVDENAPQWIKRRATRERNNILIDRISMAIRKEYKNENTSYDDLCKKYNVRTGFLEDLLGQEEREMEK